MRGPFRNGAYNVWLIVIVPALLWSAYMLVHSRFKDAVFFFSDKTQVEGTVLSSKRSNYVLGETLDTTYRVYSVKFEYSHGERIYRGQCYSSNYLLLGEKINVQLLVGKPSLAKIDSGRFTPFGKIPYVEFSVALAALVFFILTDKLWKVPKLNMPGN